MRPASLAEQHQPLRLPGQEAEQLNLGNNGLTERFYNVFRWYRPNWSRYTQPDPIGLDGGLNLYSYADDDPVGLADPGGLRPCSDQIPRDLKCFQDTYDRWFKNPRLGLGQQSGARYWGPVGNFLYCFTLGKKGSSCTAWAVGLVTALRPCNTDCCRATEVQRWFPPHTRVGIDCRCDTRAGDWNRVTTYDPFWRLP